MRKIVPLKELPLSDNFMFGAVMSDPEVCKPFLEAVLQTKIVSIQFIHMEETFTNYPGLHGIRLDVYVVDVDGVRYDIEMQGRSYNSPRLEQRTRFYQSSIDRDFLKAGDGYESLPESYVIFLCDFDYYGAGYACYERVSSIKDCPEIIYNDGSHAVFFNTRYQTVNVCKEIKEFLDYIRTNDDSLPLETALVKKVREKVNEIRNDEKMEVEYMTMQMYLRDKFNEGKAEGREEGRKEGREEGREEGRLESLAASIRSFADLVSPSEIAKRLNVSSDFVQQVLNSEKSE